MYALEATLLALLAACGLATPPSDVEPPDDPQVDQHFCCQSVHSKPWSGEGCVAIAKEHINTCSKVLYCPEAWLMDEGDVTCE